MASSVVIHLRTTRAEDHLQSPLPELIQTPSGLAILELQGTINLPQVDENGDGPGGHGLQIGRILFPDYHPETQDASSTSWMKRVHLYVGQHQRLTGEIKKLPKAVAVIRRRARFDPDVEMAGTSSETTNESLELVEIVKYKLIFSHRPEPVGTVGTG
ncbi:putative chromosome transmission fidelity protein 8 [Rosellinia necatrix]|uniref:Putative chromosome transmission fidelity protein 8 n=1 Tax=Rosellinia necatrix TaxID=77044 RepID=A0A1S7UL60_ROSNE|nr:putative chromosome transmission fidelity protein 8 [Rosellinia necatrix]